MQIHDYFLVFARIGSCIALMPWISAVYIPIRLTLALAITVMITPTIQQIHQFSIPLLIQEVLVGLFMGSVFNILFQAVNIAGNIIATQAGLSSANLFDPNSGVQNPIISNFISMLAIAMIFITNTHILIISQIINSYNIIDINPDNFTHIIVKIMSYSFNLGFKMALPCIIIGTVTYLIAGIITRLVSNIQIFFIIMPLQIWLTIFIVLLSISSIMLYYINNYRDTIMTIWR